MTFNPVSSITSFFQISALQVIVGSLLLGAIVLVVGLVQLVPNAADADHRYVFIGTGSALLLLGFVMTGVRCFCIHCKEPHVIVDNAPPALDGVNSIDVLVQRRDTQVGDRSISVTKFNEIMILETVTTRLMLHC